LAEKKLFQEANWTVVFTHIHLFQCQSHLQYILFITNMNIYFEDFVCPFPVTNVPFELPWKPQVSCTIEEDILSEFSPEILTQIFLAVEMRDIFQLSCVSKKFQNIIDSQEFWMYIFGKFFHCPQNFSLPRLFSSWKDFFWCIWTTPIRFFEEKFRNLIPDVNFIWIGDTRNSEEVVSKIISNLK